MSDLATYSAIAEIFSALTIIIASVFAAIQYIEYRSQPPGAGGGGSVQAICRAELRQGRDFPWNYASPRSCSAALFHARPNLLRLGTLRAFIRRLPDGIRMKELRAMDAEYEEAAQIFGMAVETMGLLVHERIASFQMIQQLTGGLLLSLWRKIDVWVAETREDTGNPRFAEWVQWLVERIAEREQDMVPAYLTHKSLRTRARGTMAAPVMNRPE